MQLHDLKPKTKRRNKKRVGRGGKRGTFSGRGVKGQRARAGHKIRPEIRDAIKKIPKLRGYKVKLRPRETAVVNIADLDRKFLDGETVNPKDLLKKGLIKKIGGKIPVVKLLGSGNIAKKLLVSECQLSKSAKEKIEKAGGEVKTLNPKP